MSSTIAAILLYLCQSTGFGCGLIAYFQDPALTSCELAVRDLLKAPKSYQRIKAAVLSKSRGGPSVLLIFEAMNSFGAQLQNSAECNFSLKSWSDRYNDEPAVKEAMIRSEAMRLRENPKAKPQDGYFELTRIKIGGEPVSSAALTIAKMQPFLLGLPELTESSTRLGR